ncbi:radical SAM protein [Caldanaerobacter subterraneus KAk]|uniref:Arylsulfatase regulator (Fe-S oxidoreductase) n=1 Tax=Caldanaerobacter subterraneus subsp. pacificus DSM 12653 TaxID=391606 RepID=B7R5T4_9THEO|nr:radical SAM protein [Caldanaerobacter subterraneus]KKC29883.1 arylsulfatase regulator (Fe-S oxidoreductase) [Caldanaerobacter subterraneus subsp. pacificus DSM 12653]
MKYRTSKFVHFLKGNKEDEYIIFNAFTLDVFVVDKTVKGFIESLIDPQEIEINEITKELIDKKIIIRNDFDEFAYAKKYRELIRKKAKELPSRIGFMRISLTEKCNLKCNYCFVRKIHDKKGDMPVEKFSEIMLWFIKENKGSRPVIQYFGGEPLLRMDLIELGHLLLEKAKQNGEIIDYVEEIVTNGTLMTENLAKYFISNNFNISFSIDGWKDINDKNRVFPDGSGSFDRLIEGVNNYKNAGGKLSAIITFTNDNIDKAEEIIHFLVESVGFEEISINTPQPVDKGWEVNGEEFAKAVTAVWKYCNNNKIPLNHPGNNVAFLINKKLPQMNSCMNLTYGQNNNTWGVYVTSDLKVSKCLVGFDESITLKFSDLKFHKGFETWHFNDNSKDICLECIAYNICGGPCQYETLVRNGKLNPDKCKFYKYIVKWAILQ